MKFKLRDSSSVKLGGKVDIFIPHGMILYFDVFICADRKHEASGPETDFFFFFNEEYHFFLFECNLPHALLGELLVLRNLLFL